MLFYEKINANNCIILDKTNILNGNFNQSNNITYKTKIDIIENEYAIDKFLKKKKI